VGCFRARGLRDGWHLGVVQGEEGEFCRAKGMLRTSGCSRVRVVGEHVRLPSGSNGSLCRIGWWQLAAPLVLYGALST
jgi:hypothetical protein